MQRMTVNIKTLADMDDNGTQAFTTVIIKEVKSVKKLYAPLTKKSVMEKGQYYLVTNASVGAAVNLREDSKIFSAKQFLIDGELKEEEDRFLQPRVVTLTEAFHSPLKRRISINANLQNVSPVYNGERCKRRILDIQSADSSSVMQLKLWGDKTDMDIPTLNSPVIIKNVEVREYYGRRELHSTMETVIEEDVENTEVCGEVCAACFERDAMNIVLEDKIYKISDAQMNKIFPSGTFQEVYLKCLVKAEKVLKILEKNEEPF